jgi:hypothetical protein
LKNYLCNTHGERYISYCKQCKKNLCDLCELCHNKNHNFICHREISQNINIKKNLEILKFKINDLKIEIENIIKTLNDVIYNFEIFYNISKNIINNFNVKNKNYQTLINMNRLNDINENMIEDIYNIINQNAMENKIKYIVEIYRKKNIIFNEIILKYKLGKDDRLRIFGDNFVKNNKDNYKMIIDSKVFELETFLNLKNIKIKNKELKIKLKEINISSNLNQMFYECSLLSLIKDKKGWNTINVTNMSDMF